MRSHILLIRKDKLPKIPNQKQHMQYLFKLICEIKVLQKPLGNIISFPLDKNE